MLALLWGSMLLGLYSCCIGSEYVLGCEGCLLCSVYGYVLYRVKAWRW